MEFSDLLRELVTQGKQAGYLTYDEINRMLPEDFVSPHEFDNLLLALEDLGIEVIDRERIKKAAIPALQPQEEEEDRIPSDLEELVSSSLQMYLAEMGKVPLLTREEEVNYARNIKENERKLQTIVLECPITLREIRRWDTFLREKEMSAKELMPRGRKSEAELGRMRTKIKLVSKLIDETEKRIHQIELKLKNKSLPPEQVQQYNSQLQKERHKIVSHIIGLNLA